MHALSYSHRSVSVDVHNRSLVYLSAMKSIVSKRQGENTGKHNTPPIHGRRRDEVEHGEEADDSLEEHVQARKGIDGDTESAERKVRLWQRLAADPLKQDTSYGDGVGEAAGAGEQAGHGVEGGG